MRLNWGTPYVYGHVNKASAGGICFHTARTDSSLAVESVFQESGVYSFACRETKTLTVDIPSFLNHNDELAYLLGTGNVQEMSGADFSFDF